VGFNLRGSQRIDRVPVSWRTILLRRDAFRAAISNFQPDVLAGWGKCEVERLLRDEAIARNRAKIEATLANARAIVALRQQGSPLDGLVRSHAPTSDARAPRSWREVRARAEAGLPP
jgi:DNA-3-methyladenine glycosylase I